MYFVYVIQNPDGRRYVGYSSDPERRLRQHNDPEYRGSKTTKRIAGPWPIVLVEPFGTRQDAMKRERFLKSGQGRELVERLLEKKLSRQSPPQAD